MEIDAQYYELSLLPDIPEPLKEFKYFLILHPGVEAILPPESMVNFYLDVTIRGATGEVFMRSSVLFPVQREWLTNCWNVPQHQPLFQPQYQTPLQSPPLQLQSPQQVFQPSQHVMQSPQPTVPHSPMNSIPSQYSVPSQPPHQAEMPPNPTLMNPKALRP
eukprot:TRINITY_DN4595_c0_g1_i3.p1 TRINITY_DN4595_c0_g1~~TRINITY_DN4595_c0_g1_i3.p1  ORF type:complete len:161 (-),score=29.53 TRINITY_DN4595_c0_g1_i3:559-1041(-)